MKQLLVTVGTTEFDQLIEMIDNESFLSLMQKFGFQRLLVQHGRGIYSMKVLTAPLVAAKYGIEVLTMRFHDNLAEVIATCDLLIGHCGAGTILDTVSAGTALVVVINTTLQGNHQTELADMLEGQGQCKVTIPAKLLSCLQCAYEDNLLGKYQTQQKMQFPILQPDRFAIVVDEMFDFS